MFGEEACAKCRSFVPNIFFVAVILVTVGV